MVGQKRNQDLAERWTRSATIQNREVPSLRPGVVEQLAEDISRLQIITNGGIQSAEEAEERVKGDHRIVGAMVGRSVINHPCAFGTVDSLWLGQKQSLKKPTREEVLLDYIQYCEREEELFRMSTVQGLEGFKRRLVGVPFHLFAGELGNNEYQRFTRKLMGKSQRHYTSAGILRAALSQVPTASAVKPVNECSAALDDIAVFEAAQQRAGPLQRTIH